MLMTHEFDLFPVAPLPQDAPAGDAGDEMYLKRTVSAAVQGARARDTPI